MRFLLILGLLSCLWTPCWTQEKEVDDTDENLFDVAFLQEVDGEEQVFVRMPPSQWRFAKARSRINRHGKISVGLYARQVLALRLLMGDQYEWGKIVVRVESQELRALKGLKNHWFVCPKDAFLKGPEKAPEFVVDGNVRESDQNFGELLTKSRYQRHPVPTWDVRKDEYLFLSNANLVDVDQGTIREERGVLVCNQRIEKLVMSRDFDSVRRQHRIKKEIDLQDRYLIPGMSDIHCHVTLISEFDMGARAFRYFDAQRMKNTEEVFKSGCTFVRDCGGTASKIGYLKKEIEAGRMIGPKIMSCNGALTPKGGMWDVGPVKNEMARFVFGGKLLWFPENDAEITQAMKELHETGNDFFKLYFEEKPLYGFKETTVYNLFSLDQARLIKRQSGIYRKPTAAHAMFMKGINLLIESEIDTIEHLSCDRAYTVEKGRAMKAKNISIIPTVSLGCYLSMNCGTKGYPNDPEVLYFQELRKSTCKEEIARYVVPELQANYSKFFEWLDERMEERKMPMVGQVYPERVHNFACLAPKSIANLRKAGTRVGIGTDGGTGITFAGNIAKEMEILHRYGYSHAELLRMATLGNMEILRMEKERGSLEEGKYADMVLLSGNPLEDIRAVRNIAMIFKDGRLYYQNVF